MTRKILTAPHDRRGNEEENEFGRRKSKKDAYGLVAVWCISIHAFERRTWGNCEKNTCQRTSNSSLNEKIEMN